jgi:hypothetical protein
VDRDRSRGGIGLDAFREIASPRVASGNADDAPVERQSLGQANEPFDRRAEVLRTDRIAV